ncbi:Rrf2 family transcriptional regulator [Flavihumibacter sp. ZG627]|uniref:RrF2 family transcriptional regulator n=1 Tax=Flavihumibacter sp. ZG627 TaxID=1463156 RepID=UPI00057F71A8|nr:Rrf2 family transcriptional regulator [Flavihumibacter sp. ZG627]KIC89575.1 Rrf2 family transcriptional regulator [Flavihumibacter sp. ZG627]
MLTNTCKTAIKAVIYLAARFETGEKSGIREIAEHIDASEHTVGKMLQTLVRQGVINSVKGPTGGFFISKQQRNQPIINIVEAIDGRQIFTGCGLGLTKCSAAHPCPIHDEYKAARDLYEKIFRSNRIADLCDPVTNGLAYLTG